MSGRCGGCAFYERGLAGPYDKGKCHRYPPPWHEVELEDGCGEFETPEGVKRRRDEELGERYTCKACGQSSLVLFEENTPNYCPGCGVKW